MSRSLKKPPFVHYKLNQRVEAMQAFGADKELTETRRQAGAVIESGVMTPISDDFFTNYPDAFMQH